MENENKTFSTPDEAGWHFFKESKKATPCVVYINEDGIGFAMNENGEVWELEDLIGEWEPIEPQNM